MNATNQQPIARRQQRRTRSGFTLVEVLTVIVIIGILAAITVPAVSIALRRARTGAIRLEIDGIAQALEAYKLQYGEYPPDFYDWNQVERHFLKAFPDIDDNELRILAQFTHYNSSMQRGATIHSAATGTPFDPRTDPAFDHYPHAIDRAEALVFCLAGFSKDKARPFTGQGGPIVRRSGANFTAEPDGDADDFLAFQYNTDRETSGFEFDDTQLSMVLLEGGAGPPFTFSDDDLPGVEASDVDSPPGGAVGVLQALRTIDPATANGIVCHPDPFPTYRPSSSTAPIAYFDDRSYNTAWGNAVVSAWNASGANNFHLQNLYLPAGDIDEVGVARPYASSIVDTTAPTTILGTPVTAPRVYEFAQSSSFQLISAGLDGNYGGLVGESIGASSPGINIYPIGGYYNPFVATPSSTTKYQDDLEAGRQIYNSQPQLDNITNFSTSDLESDLP